MNDQHDDPLLQWRSEFPILETTTYLINNSLGAMPRAVYDSLRDYADTWATHGIRAWGEGWWDLNVAVGDKVGAIIGAPPNTVSMHQNISLVMGILMTCFDFDGQRRKIVIDEGIFPSVYYVLRGMVPDHIEMVMVKSEDDGTTVPVDKIIDAIDDQTLFVLPSHVLFRSAFIVDVKAISAKAHQVGATVIVDGYHAGGIVPFSVMDINPDYYMGGVLKWMCGGPGGVFLYAREDHLKTVTPGLTGWMAHKRPFGFEVDDIDFREDAFRFLNGTPAVPNLYAVQPGIDIIAQVGVENIRRKSQHQTALILDRARAAGYDLNTVEDPELRGGSVIINPPHAYEVSRALIEREILIDYRPQAGIRISPHFYNTDAEVHLAMDAVAEILEDGDWEQFATDRDFIT